MWVLVRVFGFNKSCLNGLRHDLYFSDRPTTWVWGSSELITFRWNAFVDLLLLSRITTLLAVSVFCNCWWGFPWAWSGMIMPRLHEMACRFESRLSRLRKAQSPNSSDFNAHHVFWTITWTLWQEILEGKSDNVLYFLFWNEISRSN